MKHNIGELAQRRLENHLKAKDLINEGHFLEAEEQLEITLMNYGPNINLLCDLSDCYYVNENKLLYRRSLDMIELELLSNLDEIDQVEIDYSFSYLFQQFEDNAFFMKSLHLFDIIQTKNLKIGTEAQNKIYLSVIKAAALLGDVSFLEKTTNSYIDLILLKSDYLISAFKNSWIHMCKKSFNSYLESDLLFLDHTELFSFEKRNLLFHFLECYLIRFDMSQSDFQFINIQNWQLIQKLLKNDLDHLLMFEQAILKIISFKLYQKAEDRLDVKQILNQEIQDGEKSKIFAMLVNLKFIKLKEMPEILVLLKKNMDQPSYVKYSENLQNKESFIKNSKKDLSSEFESLLNQYSYKGDSDQSDVTVQSKDLDQKIKTNHTPEQGPLSPNDQELKMNFKMSIFTEDFEIKETYLLPLLTHFTLKSDIQVDHALDLLFGLSDDHRDVNRLKLKLNLERLNRDINSKVKINKYFKYDKGQIIVFKKVILKNT